LTARKNKFDPDSIFNSANKIRALYDNEAAEIIILNDFNRQSYRCIALAAFGVIYYEDMIGIITTIPNVDCSPIYLGRTVDLFESLVLAGHIPSPLTSFTLCPACVGKFSYFSTQRSK